jgi:hypothetical protein
MTDKRTRQHACVRRNGEGLLEVRDGTWPAARPIPQGTSIMDTDALTHSTDTRTAVKALSEAASTAGYAPSIRNSRPWRWRLTGNTLDLHLVRSRIRPTSDPDGRLATLSCGSALHHARIAMAADGWQITVTRMLQGADRDLLARLHVDHRGPADPTSVTLLRSVPLRRTDRRAAVDTPLDPPALTALTAAIEAQGTRQHTLRPGQLLGPAAAADHAQVLVMLYGSTDEPLDWLRAGEALSAGWLTATGLGVSVLPHSASPETIAIREARRAMIAGSGFPYLVLRLGAVDPADAGMPRRPGDQIIERY